MDKDIILEGSGMRAADDDKLDGEYFDRVAKSYVGKPEPKEKSGTRSAKKKPNNKVQKPLAAGDKDKSVKNAVKNKNERARAAEDRAQKKDEPRKEDKNKKPKAQPKRGALGYEDMAEYIMVPPSDADDSIFPMNGS
ncbi:MAG: hypothetical protein LBP26_00420 [Clostridiales bacterium]|jgi:hypothetical protein|nr:hypothetical protein [Clostridiales bacterium]